MTRISELTYGCVGDVLEVRLLRKWYHTSRSKETWFLCVDKHGDCIQILGNKTSQKFIESRFQLNRCYSIADYTCATADKYQKMVQTPIYINVGRASTICDIEDKEEIPKHWFSFASFSYLLTLSRSPNSEFPDVIGYCKGLRHLFKQNDMHEPFVKLDLCDESGCILPITLWKECIEVKDKFDPSLAAGLPNDTIVAVTNLKVAKYGDSLSLTSTYATHVLINPKCPTTTLLLQQLSTASTDSTSLHVRISTITDLKTASHEFLLGKTFSVRAHITEYDPTINWYSTYCSKCRDPILPKGKEWFCASDGKDLHPKFSLSLSATIADNSNSIPIIFSDDAIQTLCGSKCEHLVCELGYINRSELPPLFNTFIDKDLTFYLQLTRRAINISENHFVATNIITDIPSQDVSIVSPTDAPPVTPIDKSAHVSSSSTITASSPTSNTRKRLQFGNPEAVSTMKRERNTD